MNIGLHGILSILLLIAIRAEPFKPASDSFVVERLAKSLIALQKSPRLKTGQTGNSNVCLAREYLQIAQRTSDPAFVRYAGELLVGAASKTNAEALFLNAVISQHKHDFETALQQLKEVLQLAPGNEDAALLGASILTTKGKYQEAKAIFAKNLRLTSTLRGLAIFLTIASLNGDLEKTELTLLRAINSRANNTELAFTWCALAEMAARRGDWESSETRFRKSLELEPENSYTLAAYCDLLTALGRNNEVTAHLGPDSMSEALLTRRFLAMKASRDQVTPFADQLKKNGHWRELAMLQLDLMHEPEAALENALRNWHNQKEAIDALIVLRSALACQKPSAAEAVTMWLAMTKLEDIRIECLTRSLEQQLAQR